jgi:hypothetical protein
MLRLASAGARSRKAGSSQNVEQKVAAKKGLFEQAKA